MNKKHSLRQWEKDSNMKETVTITTTVQKGQALITLLFFMIIGITLIAAASVVTLQNVSSTSAAEQGEIAYYAAENGIEDALLLLLRYPPNSSTPYTGGTTTYDEGQAVVSVTSTPTSITITSVGSYNSAVRTVQVQETNGSGGWQVTSWKEI